MAQWNIFERVVLKNNHMEQGRYLAKKIANINLF